MRRHDHMKAIILAGGLGTRLRPLTDNTPKPLLPIAGKPIMEHAINNLKKHGITDIILGISYHADKIKEYFGDGTNFGVNITYSIEETPLGTGGAVVQANGDNKEPFILMWGDNLSDVNMTEMIASYEKNNAIVTMALTPREDVEHFGVADLEGDMIKRFVEKPPREEAPSNQINAGCFIVNPEVLKMLPEKHRKHHSKDKHKFVIPFMSGLITAVGIGLVWVISIVLLSVVGSMLRGNADDILAFAVILFAILISLAAMIGIPIYTGNRYGASTGVFTMLSMLGWMFVFAIVIIVVMALLTGDVRMLG